MMKGMVFLSISGWRLSDSMDALALNKLRLEQQWFDSRPTWCAEERSSTVCFEPAGVFIVVIEGLLSKRNEICKVVQAQRARQTM